ncbi:MAG TPA: FKBP-type peptidyl-prolyl cis-trans isomerase, partial [Flavobacteriales bacterium]|nr:FKBP-type peptidyl-prolyl cis-trans isomerase [Flavobacteriales bacterium]
RSKLDSANVDAVSEGLRDGMDSASLMDPSVAQQVIQKYFQRMQEAQRAEEAKKFEGNRAAGEAFLAENGKKPGITTTSSGLQYEVIKAGTGAKPTMDSKVRVHYTGYLIDGTKFQSSHDSGQPIDYPVTGFVPGWVEALQLMPVGSTWKVYIPSDLGYGAQGGANGMIPPNSALIFELELIDIVK